jgi:hypothetical protein
MFHPFQEDPKELNDTQLQERISELSKKYTQAARLGKGELLTQLQTFVTIYRDEIRRRAMQPIKTNDQDKDLDQLINVD